MGAVPGSSFFREPVNHLIRLHFAKNDDTLNEATEPAGEDPEAEKIIPLGPVRKTRTGPFSSKGQKRFSSLRPSPRISLFLPHRMEQQEAGSVVF